MIKQVHSTVLRLMSIVLLGSGTELEVLRAQSPNTKTAAVLGQLAVVEGEVKLQPKDSAESLRVSVGGLFRRGDLLEVAMSARAVVVCADLTKHELKAGVHGLPCDPPSTGPRTLLFDGTWIKIKDPRGESSTSNIPVIISPRKTKLLDPYPILRWVPVAGISTYNINVRGWNLDWSKDVGPKPEIPYPQDKDKQLISGVLYKLTVKAGKRSSDDEGVSNLLFSLLSPQEAQPIRDARQKIIALGLPGISTELLVAQLYAESELYSEAIEQLRKLPPKSMELAAAQLLGDLYFNTGLNHLAKEQYLVALRLADGKQDLFSQARAQFSLGQLHEMLGNKDEAVTYWQRAKELFQRSKNTEMIERIEEALSHLKPR